MIGGETLDAGSILRFSLRVGPESWDSPALGSTHRAAAILAEVPSLGSEFSSYTASARARACVSPTMPSHRHQQPGGMSRAPSKVPGRRAPSRGRGVQVAHVCAHVCWERFYK